MNVAAASDTPYFCASTGFLGLGSLPKGSTVKVATVAMTVWSCLYETMDLQSRQSSRFRIFGLERYGIPAWPCERLERRSLVK
ncbi:hypothetical protein C8Q70DRAFT_995155 [Cubamyces menziesii]|nr:hypothetical protein C8Q70DRAFT_995155 [Cubamyces menziesii]